MNKSKILDEFFSRMNNPFNYKATDCFMTEDGKLVCRIQIINKNRFIEAYINEKGFLRPYFP